MDVDFWLKVEQIAVAAGKITLKYWGKTPGESKKSDGSPVTVADLESHNYILTELKKVCTVPIISEEDSKKESIGSGLCFVIDPLDGTKSFIKGRDDYCVCIALLQDAIPISGVIYAPVSDELYSAHNGKVRYNGEIINFIKRHAPYVGARSLNHQHTAEQDFATKNKISHFLSIGSALKFAKMLTGEIDIYVRYAPCSEWDVAAGHALLMSYGGDILDLSSKDRLKYGKKDFLNGPFVAYVDGIDLSTP